MKIDESYLARRRFLGGLIGGGVAALGAGAAVPLAAYVGNLRSEPPPDFLVLERSQYDLAPDESRMIMYGSIPALIFRTPAPEAALRVFVATCTHLACLVSYNAQVHRIFCACHEGYYDLEGQVLAGPPPQPLAQFYTRQLGENLVIALKQENLDKAEQQN